MVLDYSPGTGTFSQALSELERINVRVEPELQLKEHFMANHQVCREASRQVKNSSIEYIESIKQKNRLKQ